jgi:hypothetical protein
MFLLIILLLLLSSDLQKSSDLVTTSDIHMSYSTFAAQYTCHRTAQQRASPVSSVLRNAAIESASFADYYILEYSSGSTLPTVVVLSTALLRSRDVDYD